MKMASIGRIMIIVGAVMMFIGAVLRASASHSINAATAGIGLLAIGFIAGTRLLPAGTPRKTKISRTS